MKSIKQNLVLFFMEMVVPILMAIVVLAITGALAYVFLLVLAYEAGF